MSATRERIHRTYPGVIIIDGGDGTSAILHDKRSPGDPGITPSQQSVLNNLNPNGDTFHTPFATTIAALDALYP